MSPLSLLDQSNLKWFKIQNIVIDEHKTMKSNGLSA